MLAHLVFLTIESAVHSSVWEGLNVRAFSRHQLQDLLRALNRYDGRKTLLYALRTDLVEMVDALYDLKSARRRPGFQGINSEPAFLVGCAPNGWFDQNAHYLTSVAWEYYIEPLKTTGLQAAVTQVDKLQTVLPSHDPPRIAFLFADFVLGSSNSIVARAAYEQSCNDLARVATALELFFSTHQTYPATLTELAPTILDSPPMDRLSNQPIRYKLTNDGRYMLWTVGFDASDNGGKVTKDRFGELGRNFRQSNYEGDWVWQYTPVKP